MAGHKSWDNTARQEALAKTNPLFGSRKLKLGTFCTNVSGAACMSTMEGVYEATWPNITTTARLADEMQFEAIVPLGRWQGFGGVTHFNEEVMEAMTFSASVTAITQKPSVFATIHVPTLHPVLAAKQATTIDHVGNGRFTLNVVTGWNKAEIELFGSPLLDHAERYVMADEWITVVKQLWTADEPFSFEGKYYSIKNACVKPHPIQPYPALMNASGSAVGKAFAAKHFDIVFSGPTKPDAASVRTQMDAYRNYAHQEFRRDIKIWMTAYMIIGDTEADARRQFEYCVYEKGDRVAADNFMTGMGVASQSIAPDVMKRIGDDMIAGYGGFALVGTKEKIAADMQMLAENGVDGILLTWPAFIDGMRRFKEDVLPLLTQAGLR